MNGMEERQKGRKEDEKEGMNEGLKEGKTPSLRDEGRNGALLFPSFASFLLSFRFGDDVAIVSRKEGDQEYNKGRGNRMEKEQEQRNRKK
jgi:hypothetical protein